MSRNIVEQSIAIAAAPDLVFGEACSFDVPSIVRGRGALPGVASVEGAGAWSAPGQTRVLTLTDGTSVRETLEAIGRSSYDYRIEGFTGPLAALASHARGRFEVEAKGAGSILSWRYEFIAASRIASPLVAMIARFLWPGYMRAALERLKQSIERS